VYQYPVKRGWELISVATLINSQRLWIGSSFDQCRWELVRIWPVISMTDQLASTLVLVWPTHQSCKNNVQISLLNSHRLSRQLPELSSSFNPAITDVEQAASICILLSLSSAYSPWSQQPRNGILLQASHVANLFTERGEVQYIIPQDSKTTQQTLHTLPPLMLVLQEWKISKQ
jgi:hypothetical protein